MAKEYIERNGLLEWAREFYPEEKVFASAVINAPTADVQEVRRGRNETRLNPVDEFICSECGYMTDDCSLKLYNEDGGYYYHCEYEYNFCPNCGAKMDKESEQE